MARNRRLERMLREAAAAEKLRLQEEPQKGLSKPNPFALGLPGFELWDKALFDGMNKAAEVGTQIFQNWFNIVSRR